MKIISTEEASKREWIKLGETSEYRTEKHALFEMSRNNTFPSIYLYPDSSIEVFTSQTEKELVSKNPSGFFFEALINEFPKKSTPLIFDAHSNTPKECFIKLSPRNLFKIFNDQVYNIKITSDLERDYKGETISDRTVITSNIGPAYKKSPHNTPDSAIIIADEHHDQVDNLYIQAKDYIAYTQSKQPLKAKDKANKKNKEEILEIATNILGNLVSRMKNDLPNDFKNLKPQKGSILNASGLEKLITERLNQRYSEHLAKHDELPDGYGSKTIRELITKTLES